jgi:hypothetical protein
MNKKEFIEEWKYFCSRINFGVSFLDNRAIIFMNEFSKNVRELKNEESKEE